MGVGETEGLVVILLGWAAYKLIGTQPVVFCFLATLACVTILGLRLLKRRSRFCARCGKLNQTDGENEQ